jgi:deoxyribonuclease-4
MQRKQQHKLEAPEHTLFGCTMMAEQKTLQEPIRVRALLSRLNPVELSGLKKLLPKKLTVPEEPEGVRYPAALLSALTDGEAYGLLGYITEDLLRLPPADITIQRLGEIVGARDPSVAADGGIAKIIKSKTTEPFLEHCRATRKKLRFVARGPIGGESEVGTGGTVVGHPDMRTPTQIFEIKMTGQLKKNWPDFLLQVFAYAALDPVATDIYLVLPLQEIVWHHDVRGWAGRAAYKAAMEAAAAIKAATMGPALALMQTYDIGAHIHKSKTLELTVLLLQQQQQQQSQGKPYQFFLSGPQSSHMNLRDADIAAAASLIAATGLRLFVHSQYLINLSTPASPETDPMGTELLIKNLQAAVALGCSGVVVHVGKSTTQTVEAAIGHMRTNLLSCLPHATTTCPILLETPAGQGTELLRTYEEFVGFVAAIGDPRLRICVDTCHVFACGSDPLVYIQRLKTEYADLLRLIHFNDSATPCGSCADRHAFIGQGHLGMEGMTALAVAGALAPSTPMLVE